MAGLKRRERTVVGVAATTFAAIAVLLLVILPALQQVRLSRLEAQRKQVELARLLGLVDQRAQIEERHLRLSNVQLRQISFTQVPVAAGNDALPAGMAAVPLQIQVSGDYLRLRAFVSALDQMPRALVVDRLAVTGVQNGVLADLTVRAFYAP